MDTFKTQRVWPRASAHAKQRPRTDSPLQSAASQDHPVRAAASAPADTHPNPRFVAHAANKVIVCRQRNARHICLSSVAAAVYMATTLMNAV